MIRVRRALRTAVAPAMALMAAWPAWCGELVLPCHGPDGRPVPNTTVLALGEDYSGEMIKGFGDGGQCRVTLSPGSFWVKAEAPGMRSVAILAVGGSAPGRELRMHPLNGTDSDGQEQLRQMVARDQAVREALGEAQRSGDAERTKRAERDMEDADAAHRVELGRWLQARGFPRAAEVGADGVGSFWLMLQHAPELLAPQLPAMRAAVAAGELPRSDLALSEDRVEMHEGRPQRYGSQLQAGMGGKLMLYCLASPELVDVRRAEMDLEPLAAYLKRFER